MVDYSKWDRMEFSDSEDDTDDANHAPRVTSLDEPGRVTIGTDGSFEIGKSSLPSNRSGMGIATAAASNNSSLAAKNAQAFAKKEQKLQQWTRQLTHNGGKHDIAIKTKEKQDIKLPIYWSQDRYAITLRLGFHHALFPSRSIRVQVTGALNYKDRFSAVGSGAMTGYKEVNEDGSAAFGVIEITSVAEDKCVTVLLSNKLPRPVYMNQDEDEIGFDIEDNILTEDTLSEDMTCTKFVVVTLSKAVPMEGMIVWWEHALLGLPKIDTSNIQERTNPVDGVMTVEEYNASMDKKQSAGGDAAKREAFAKAWDEAHRMFREKVKAREKEEVHVDD